MNSLMSGLGILRNGFTAIRTVPWSVTETATVPTAGRGGGNNVYVVKLFVAGRRRFSSR